MMNSQYDSSKGKGAKQTPRKSYRRSTEFDFKYSES